LSTPRPAYFVGDVQFLSRAAALAHIGEGSGELTEAYPGSAWTVSVHGETCPDCGASYQTVGVMGALRQMAEGRPCGCGAPAGVRS
jgi:hypothetical protein